MDEMKISSKIMRNLAATLVKRAVRKKLGYEVDIQLNELAATVTDERAHIHLSIDAVLNKGEITKILGRIGL